MILHAQLMCCFDGIRVGSCTCGLTCRATVQVTLKPDALNPDQLAILGYIHRDPVESVHQIKTKVDGPEGGKELGSRTAKQRKGIEGLTMAELSAKWSDVVEALEGVGVKITNPDHALEGALCIR